MRHRSATRRRFGYLLLGLVLGLSLACGASGEEVTASEPLPESVPADPAVGTYLRGPFPTPPSDTALPAVVNPFPSTTTTMYFAWSHANLPANEQLTFSMIAVEVGSAAPPGTTVTTAEAAMPEAGPHHGPVNFSLPRPWPPGTYRVTAVGNTIGEFGTVELRVDGAAPGGFLTVGAFCEGWCDDLCGRCGDAACGQTCSPRCHFGRDPSTVMDGSNPAVALAKTPADLDRCLADAHELACPALMAGTSLPDSCRTIQR